MIKTSYLVNNLKKFRSGNKDLPKEECNFYEEIELSEEEGLD